MSDDTSSHVRVSHLYDELLLISDIRALWRSGLSARVPECQKLGPLYALIEPCRSCRHVTVWFFELACYGQIK